MRIRRRIVTHLVSGFMFIVALIWGGCSHGDVSTSPRWDRGAVTIRITGLPPGVNSAVTVSGPGGFHATVTATGTLANLIPGRYSVSAGNALSRDPFVSTMYTGRAVRDTIPVAAARTVEDSVIYAARQGTGRLWVSSFDPRLDRAFDSGQLAVGGAITARTVLSTTARNWWTAFDSDGRMWVGTAEDRLVLCYATDQLETSGTPHAAVVISSVMQHFEPHGLAFDASGALWVSIPRGLVKYNPAQLVASGSPSPSVVISTSRGDLMGIAFDRNGGLWTCDQVQNRVLGFASSQLSASGEPTPAVTIGNALNSPMGLAFDADGALWVSDAFHNRLLKYSAAELAKPTGAMPSVAIYGSAGYLNLPVGMAFDNRGNLWVLQSSPNALVEFSAEQIASSGAYTPVTSIDGIVCGIGLAFNPPPDFLPIYR